jgi:hypothetical protein
MKKTHWLSLGGVAAGVAVLVASTAAADDPAPTARVGVGPVAVELQIEAPKPSEYWIGMACGRSLGSTRAGDCWSRTSCPTAPPKRRASKCTTCWCPPAASRWAVSRN